EYVGPGPDGRQQQFATRLVDRPFRSVDVRAGPRCAFHRQGRTDARDDRGREPCRGEQRDGVWPGKDDTCVSQSLEQVVSESLDDFSVDPDNDLDVQAPGVERASERIEGVCLAETV